MIVARWSEAEDAVLRELNGKVPHATIAETVGRSSGAVRNRIYTLGISVNDNSWSDEELAKALTTYAGPIENANNHGTYPQWAIARHRIAGKQLKVIRRALLKEPA